MKTSVQHQKDRCPLMCFNEESSLASSSFFRFSPPFRPQPSPRGRLVLEPRSPATDSFYRLSDFSVVVMVVYSEVAARRDRGVVAGILPEKIWPDTQVEGLETEALC